MITANNVLSKEARMVALNDPIIFMIIRFISMLSHVIEVNRPSFRCTITPPFAWNLDLPESHGECGTGRAVIRPLSWHFSYGVCLNLVGERGKWRIVGGTIHAPNFRISNVQFDYDMETQPFAIKPVANEQGKTSASHRKLFAPVSSGMPGYSSAEIRRVAKLPDFSKPRPVLRQATRSDAYHEGKKAKRKLRKKKRI